MFPIQENDVTSSVLDQDSMQHYIVTPNTFLNELVKIWGGTEGQDQEQKLILLFPSWTIQSKSQGRKEVSATDRGLGWNRSSPEEGARVWAGEGGHPRGGAGGKPDEGAGSQVEWKGHPHRDMLNDKKCHLKGAPSSKSKEKIKHQTNDTNRW